MSKVYCLLAKSSIGKDTIQNMLVDKGFKRVVSHTSRPKRSNEIKGINYYFISKKEMINKIKNKEFVETRSYDVVENETWLYGIHKDSIDLTKENNYICIVDGQGFQSLVNYYGKENVVGIYLWVNNRERLLRALNRCELNDTAVDEIVRRYIKDDEAFTKEIINKCILRINNINADETLNIILRNIKNGL